MHKYKFIKYKQIYQYKKQINKDKINEQNC